MSVWLHAYVSIYRCVYVPVSICLCIGLCAWLCVCLYVFLVGYFFAGYCLLFTESIYILVADARFSSGDNIWFLPKSVTLKPQIVKHCKYSKTQVLKYSSLAKSVYLWATRRKKKHPLVVDALPGLVVQELQCVTSLEVNINMRLAIFVISHKHFFSISFFTSPYLSVHRFISFFFVCLSFLSLFFPLFSMFCFNYLAHLSGSTDSYNAINMICRIIIP